MSGGAEVSTRRSGGKGAAIAGHDRRGAEVEGGPREKQSVKRQSLANAGVVESSEAVQRLDRVELATA